MSVLVHTSWSHYLQAPAPETRLLARDLSEQASRAAQEIIVAGQSANTLRSYASAVRYWCAWNLARTGQNLSLPMASSVVIQFLIDHTLRSSEGQMTFELPAAIDQALVDARMKGALGPLKVSTIQHRLSVLSMLHQLHHMPNPCEQPEVRQVMSNARRAAAKSGEQRRKKTAATREVLETLLATCDDTRAGIRDRAILLLGFSAGGRRRSELASLEFSQLKRAPAGAYWLRLGSTKSDAEDSESCSTRDKPVAGRAAQALIAWLEASGISEGAVFRRLWNNRVGPALSPAAIAEIVKRRARIAGVEGDWGGHSLRSGFVTEAGRNDVPLGEVMAMSDYRQIGTVLVYFQAGKLLNGRAARLMESDTEPNEK